jgi:hypothetical protein
MMRCQRFGASAGAFGDIAARKVRDVDVALRVDAVPGGSVEAGQLPDLLTVTVVVDVNGITTIGKLEKTPGWVGNNAGHAAV